MEKEHKGFQKLNNKHELSNYYFLLITQHSNRDKIFNRNKDIFGWRNYLLIDKAIKYSDYLDINESDT